MSKIITEEMIASDFTFRETKISKISGKKITNRVRMRCPNRKCHNIFSELQHGIPYVCPKCGLKMTKWGNMLECTMIVKTLKEKVEENVFTTLFC